VIDTVDEVEVRLHEGHAVRALEDNHLRVALIRVRVTILHPRRQDTNRVRVKRAGKQLTLTKHAHIRVAHLRIRVIPNRQIRASLPRLQRVSSSNERLRLARRQHRTPAIIRHQQVADTASIHIPHGTLDLNARPVVTPDTLHRRLSRIIAGNRHTLRHTTRQNRTNRQAAIVRARLLLKTVPRRLKVVAHLRQGRVAIRVRTQTVNLGAALRQPVLKDRQPFRWGHWCGHDHPFTGQ